MIYVSMYVMQGFITLAADRKLFAEPLRIAVVSYDAIVVVTKLLLISNDASLLLLSSIGLMTHQTTNFKPALSRTCIEC